MNSRLKKVIIVSVGISVLLLVSVVILNYIIKNKLKNQIENTPETVEILYESVEVDVLNGSAKLLKPLISVYGKTTGEINVQIGLESLQVGGFGYWNFFTNDIISVDNLIINQPNVKYYHNAKVNSSSYKNGTNIGLKQLVYIKSFQIQDADVEVYDVSNDSLMLKTEKLNFQMDLIEINPSKEIKLTGYNDFTLSSNAVFYSVNSYENLNLEHLKITSIASKFKGLKLKTKYSKETLSHKISVERDHFDLVVDSVEISNQKFGFKQDSLFYFKSECVDFYQPNFIVYRDKLVVDDMSYKPLYSKSLRDLDFEMTLNVLHLNNASVTYIEKVKKDTQGGQLLFSKLNAEITNLSNTYTKENTLTSANIEAVFMEATPLRVQWDFDVNNRADEFIFEGELGKLNADSMNQFMIPNLNVRLEGEINKTYFTINGNDNTSRIDLKLRYDDFDVVVLKENGKEENKFLSGLVNIFVSKDSKDKSDEFRHGSKSDIERVKNKSVFNYLWLNIQAGLLNAMTGDGKKNETD
ncbi:hypothetical protein APS56_00110 [Pseudalgibacter alginicilyticus]|uniref:DUF748 domain-containing protein n=1 Tax=Pseudalgibacter alginicilyticus TaxID=1736674 RepID=A0A0P0CHA4_9FLAO|nr:hypothetical protein [Pseudalgibacter alginicilyticus]ALJ03645.1 hypothetical protein APS56_00110 [Pseudalgibacter alginicilyticus]